MMRSGLTCAFVAVVAAVVCGDSACADDGGMETAGGAVRLMQAHGSVRMVSERVRARVSTDQIDVDCIFVMKNEGPADTVLFGFPDGAIGEACKENEFLSFRIWVDGVEVKCVLLPDAARDSEDCPVVVDEARPVPSRGGADREGPLHGLAVLAPGGRPE